MIYPGSPVAKSGVIRIVLFFRRAFIALLFLLSALAEGFSQGNILILPRRVVFEGSRRSQDLTIANTGIDTSTYIISLVQMRMNDDGSFDQVTVPEEGQFFADKFLRFYPRKVVLGPKQSQLVKMQYIKGANMESGEYRSHIYFRADQKTNVPDENGIITDTTPVTAKLIPVFGITIPVIIRVGESKTQVSLSDLSFTMIKDTVATMKLTFNRKGNFSVFGDITVTYVPDQGKETRVAIVKGIAVYTPNLFRRFQCTLEKGPGIDYHSGKLRVQFTSTVDTKSQKLAEEEILLH